MLVTKYATNADTERFLRTLEEELVRLREGGTSPAVLFAAPERWIADHNTGYLHSASAPARPRPLEAEHLDHAIPSLTAC